MHHKLATLSQSRSLILVFKQLLSEGEARIAALNLGPHTQQRPRTAAAPQWCTAACACHSTESSRTGAVVKPHGAGTRTWTGVRHRAAASEAGSGGLGDRDGARHGVRVKRRRGLRGRGRREIRPAAVSTSPPLRLLLLHKALPVMLATSIPGRPIATTLRLLTLTLITTSEVSCATDMHR